MCHRCEAHHLSWSSKNIITWSVRMSLSPEGRRWIQDLTRWCQILEPILQGANLCRQRFLSLERMKCFSRWRAKQFSTAWLLYPQWEHFNCLGKWLPASLPKFLEETIGFRFRLSTLWAGLGFKGYSFLAQPACPQDQQYKVCPPLPSPIQQPQP